MAATGFFLLVSVWRRKEGGAPCLWGAAPVVCLFIFPRPHRGSGSGRASRPAPEQLWNSLLDDLGDDPRADGAATLADGEPETLVHGDRLDQLDRHLDVVTRHHHLRPLGEVGDPGHVGGAEVELRTVAGEERRVATTLLLLQAVDLGFELGVRGDRARLAENLATLDLLALGAAEQRADVVARLPLVEELAEHLDAGDGGFARLRVDADDFDLVTGVDDPLLDTAGGDGATAGDREDVLDRHQEGFVELADRLRDVGVERRGQLEDGFLGLLVAFQRLQGRALDDRGLFAREVVFVEQVLDLLFDELDEFLVVDHVDFVQEHDHVRDVDLTGEQDVLAGLGHDAVGRGHDQDRAVHLGGTGDHVLDVVGVARAVDVGVVPVLGLVLDVGGRDRDAAFLLLGSVVDLLEGLRFCSAHGREGFGDRGRQRRLAMVDVTDGADVHMRLIALEFLLSHLLPFRLSKVGGSVWFKCLNFLSGAWQRVFPCLRANLRNIARFDPWWLSAPDSALRGGPSRVARARRDDLFSDVRGNFLVLLELHRVRRAALRRGSQIGCVAEHFAERDMRLDRQGVAALVLSLHLAAPPREVADHVAEEVLRGHDLDRHHRLEEHGVGFAGRLLDRHRTGDFEGHLRGVDVVVGAIDEFGFDVDHRVAGLDAVLQRLLHPLLGRADVFAGDDAAADFVLEDEALAGSRLAGDDAVAELAAAAGLADEAGDDFLDPLAHRLAVGDLRLADVRLDFELAQHPVDDHLEVELAHPVDQGLPGFVVGFDPEGRVLLAEPLQGVAHLLLVGFGLRLDRDRDHRLREFDRLQRDRGVGRGQRVAGAGFFEADARADGAGVGLLDLLARVRVHHQEAADPLGAAGFDVQHAAAGLQFAGV